MEHTLKIARLIPETITEQGEQIFILPLGTVFHNVLIHNNEPSLVYSIPERYDSIYEYLFEFFTVNDRVRDLTGKKYLGYVIITTVLGDITINVFVSRLGKVSDVKN